MVKHREGDGTWGVVYTLCDGKDNVFYVGATVVKLGLRLRRHISESKYRSGENPGKTRKLKELKYNATITPIDWIWILKDDLNKLKNCTDLYDLEQRWIGWHIKKGFNLTNKLVPYSQSKKKTA